MIVCARTRTRRKRVCPRATGGFTLIELLVVIAIISLLVSILLPSLSRAKDLAESVLCMANQRQLALSFAYYCDDNDDGMMPRTIGHPDINSSWWPALIVSWRYCIDSKMFYEPGHTIIRCPTRERTGPSADKSYAMNYFVGAINDLGVPSGWVGRRSGVDHASETFYVADGDPLGHNSRYRWAMYSHASLSWNQLSLMDVDRHPRGAVILYADNHVDASDIARTLVDWQNDPMWRRAWYFQPPWAAWKGFGRHQPV